MAKVKDLGDGNYGFYCPGCKTIHVYWTNRPSTPNWTFNGNLDNPSFTPSLLNRWGKEVDPKWQEPTDPAPDGGWSGRCHLYVTNGVIEFCGDCTHSMAGKRFPLPEVGEYLTPQKKENE